VGSDLFIRDRIAGEPPAAAEQLALQLLGSSIDLRMIGEKLHRFRSVGPADEQFESRRVGPGANLVHEMFSGLVKAPQHTPIVSVERVLGYISKFLFCGILFPRQALIPADAFLCGASPAFV
jgi:hypothetical protein